VAHEPEHRLGHPLRGQDLIDGPGSDRAARHPVVLRGGRVLRDRHPAPGLDRLEAEGAVRSGAGQDDADRPLLRVRGQAAQKEVDRHADAAGLDGRYQRQGSPADAQVLRWWDHIDVIRLQGRIARHLHHQRLTNPHRPVMRHRFQKLAIASPATSGAGIMPAPAGS